MKKKHVNTPSLFPGLIMLLIMLSPIVVGCGGGASKEDQFSTTINEKAISNIQVLFKDADNDGYSDGASIKSASSVYGYRTQSQLISTEVDCDDNDAEIAPDAEEDCQDDLDNNCNGLINEACSNLNRKPRAFPISLKIDKSVTVLDQQLEAYDEDGDKLIFELISETEGPGYYDAVLDSDTGVLHLSFLHDGTQEMTLAYRVTDGFLFSENAVIQISVSDSDLERNQAGDLTEPPESYAGYPNVGLNETLNGVGLAKLPVSIDLSNDFPVPGNQGSQNSCVGWSTAFAIKSYQERIDQGWDLDTNAHIFSPAFIYNQINGGKDSGAYITDALDLLVTTGAATWASMPYYEGDYRTQPDDQAMSEAQNYKIRDWRVVFGTSQIKEALANEMPVVASIKVYDAMFYLHGTDSVYNTMSDQFKFNHSVAIVGYDDNRFGGAFRMMNWWGQSWGDNGFCWIPYQFFAKIANSSYIMEDEIMPSAEVDVAPPVTPAIPVTSSPPVAEALPNLVVANWLVDYDERPDGAGKFSWRVTNVGSGPAANGAEVALVLSQDKLLSSDDTVLISENIRFDMTSGRSVYRDNSNAIDFYLPEYLESGSYHLICVVDAPNEIDESDETDNTSVGVNILTIKDSLPDLYPFNWEAEWDLQSGEATLAFRVKNKGLSEVADTNWSVNLVLSPDETIGNGNELVLYSEKAQFVVPAGASIYRDDTSWAVFNLFRTQSGQVVPNGTYYIALWIDAADTIWENDETNNVSLGFNRVSIGQKSAAAFEGDRSTQGYHGTEYNGRILPSRKKRNYVVLSSPTPFTRLSSMKASKDVAKKQLFAVGDDDPGNCFDKSDAPRNYLVFPDTDAIPIVTGK